jgi:hypothetical protein
MNANEKDWKVDIEEKGRYGVIHYVEGAHKVRFDWEFSGGNSIVFIWGPKAEKWNDMYSWAADRRQLVFERVAESVIKQKAPSCKAKFDLNAGTIDVYKP